MLQKRGDKLRKTFLFAGKEKRIKRIKIRAFQRKSNVAGVKSINFTSARENKLSLLNCSML